MELFTLCVLAIMALCINFGKMFTPRGSGYQRGALQKQEELINKQISTIDELKAQSDPARQKLFSTLADSSQFTDTPDWRGYKLKKYTPLNYNSLLPNIPNAGNVPTVSLGGLSGLTPQQSLQPYTTTPDASTVGNTVSNAYGTLNNLNLNDAFNQRQNTANLDLMQRGLGNSTFATGTSSGLQNWKTTQGARMGAEGELARLDAEAKTRQEAADMRTQMLGLDRQSQLDNQNTFLTQQQLEEKNRNELNDRAATLRNWLLGDTEAANNITNQELMGQSALSAQQKAALAQYIAMLAQAGDVSPLLSAMSGTTAGYGNIASSYGDMAKNSIAGATELLKAFGSLAGSGII